MKVEKPIRAVVPRETAVRMFYAEFHRALAAPSAQQFAADLNEVLRTALFLLVSVPAFVLASLLFAASMYLRLATALLMK